jgi:hypothetical protein
MQPRIRAQYRVAIKAHRLSIELSCKLLRKLQIATAAREAKIRQD